MKFRIICVMRTERWTIMAESAPLVMKMNMLKKKKKKYFRITGSVTACNWIWYLDRKMFRWNNSVHNLIFWRFFPLLWDKNCVEEYNHCFTHTNWKKSSTIAIAKVFVTCLVETLLPFIQKLIPIAHIWLKIHTFNRVYTKFYRI